MQLRQALLLLIMAFVPAGLVGHGAAAAQEQKPAAEPGTATDAQYRLSIGDKLHILVFGQDDVSGEFQIDGAGNITMPLLGQVQAASRTLTELRADITTALDRDYIVNPKVSIEVLNYRPFYILGQVASPGSYPYVTGMDVRQAVAIAGGFTPRARTSTVTVIRQSAQGAVKIEATPDVPVLPGDTIEIQRRLF
jgi:protein involved in polysaccharide export with SLBB domain